jgi:hypothetical protein
MLSKHQGKGPIPAAQLGFVGRKLRNDLHHLVLDAFQKSGLTQAELADRLGADKSLVCRQLGAPGNWTIDTVAKMLFAINGSYVVAATVDADTPALANYTQPSWLQGKVLPPPPAFAGGGPSTVVMTIAPATAKPGVKPNAPIIASGGPGNATSIKPLEIAAE